MNEILAKDAKDETKHVQNVSEAIDFSPHKVLATTPLPAKTHSSPTVKLYAIHI